MAEARSQPRETERCSGSRAEARARAPCRAQAAAGPSRTDRPPAPSPPRPTPSLSQICIRVKVQVLDIDDTRGYVKVVLKVFLTLAREWLLTCHSLSPVTTCHLLPAACCLLPAACCLLPAACCLLPAALSLCSALNAKPRALSLWFATRCASRTYTVYTVPVRVPGSLFAGLYVDGFNCLQIERDFKVVVQRHPARDRAHVALWRCTLYHLESEI